ncbi:MAG: substrate-binding domain-containing protein [Alphaproteobacteria bacterium]
MHKTSLSAVTLAAAAAALGLTSAAWAQDAFMDEVAEAVVRYAGPQSDWRGPTESPDIAADKHIAYVSSNQQNDASREWGSHIEDVGARVGWEVTVIDGQGSPVGWQRAVDQAIALQVDGIVMDADAASLQPQIEVARENGIVIVGIHAAAYPGPQEDIGLFNNIQQDPRDIGKAQADWIIQHSGGTARVVVTSHCEYAIACTKAHATEERLMECEGCEVLEFSNSPIAEVAQRQPALVTSWVQTYGTPLYITSVADYTADYQVPALRAGGVGTDDVILVSADGNQSAYERIRAGDQYQQVTVSEPYRMQAFQAIDELNRAFNGEGPSGFVQDPYLVTTDNVDAEGGDQNTFIPSNGYEERYLELWGVEG